MKKISLALLLVGITFCLTSCFDVVEDVFLNRDGTGKYAITMDMSSLFSDPFMKGMIKESMKEQEGLEDMSMEKDTVIYLKDDPKIADLSPEDRKIAEKVVMRMTMSESKEKMVVVFEFPFDKVADISALTRVFQNMDTGKDISGFMGGNSLIPGGEALFDFSKNKLTRKPAPKPEATAEEDENMAMMKMFLGTANYKTIYHLPGKVKKATIANAEVDKNTVTVTNSLLDLIEGKAKIEGEIKFK